MYTSIKAHDYDKAVQSELSKDLSDIPVKNHQIFHLLNRKQNINI